MRQIAIWTTAATLAFAGMAFGQAGPQQQQAGAQQQTQIHKPADGKGLNKQDAKLAKKQRKEAAKAAKQAEKAQRKADKQAQARAKTGPRDGTGYGVDNGQRAGGMGGAQASQGGGGARGRGR